MRRSENSFLVIGDKWLKSCSGRIAKTTHRKYTYLLNNSLKELHDKNVEDITFSDIETILTNSKKTGSTFNEYLFVIQTVLDYAERMDLIDRNPAKRVRKAKKPAPAPDPLTEEEVDRVIEFMSCEYSINAADYFDAAFFTGARPSELIAFHLDDYQDGLLTVSKAKVWGIDKGTKTGKDRVIELHPRAEAAVRSARWLSKCDHIFTMPCTGTEYPNVSYVSSQFWHPALKRLGIRDRDARQTRHTCATMMLMRGCNPAWAAEQLGHSVEMFLGVYSKWLKGPASKIEFNKWSTVGSQPVSLQQV